MPNALHRVHAWVHVRQEDQGDDVHNGELWDRGEMIEENSRVIADSSQDKATILLSSQLELGFA
jgi:hypothetical protein